VRKTFVGHGTFVGEVVRCTPYTDKVLFSVQYPDGDQEDMDLEEVKQHLVPVGEKTQAGSRGGGREAADPAAAAAIAAANAFLSSSSSLSSFSSSSFASSSSSFSSNAAAAITAATALLVRSVVPGHKDSEMGKSSEDSEDSGESSEE
jgi:hypothetical protein